MEVNMRYLIFLLTPCLFAGELQIRFVYPPERPIVIIRYVPNYEQKQKAEREYRVALKAAKERKAEEERAFRTVFARRLEEQNKTKIDPDKDEYRKLLIDRIRKEEAINDPIAAEVRAKWRDEPRNDYKEWKERGSELDGDQFAEWRKAHPAQKQKEEAKDFDVVRLFNLQPKKKPQVKEIEE